MPEDAKKDVVLVGFDRTGYSIFHKLIKLKKEFLVIDQNPMVIRKLIHDKISCIYGDIGNPEILERLNFEKIKLIISTVPDERASHYLIQKAKEINPDISVFVTVYQIDDALDLYEAGADYVILPHLIGGDHVSFILEDISEDFTKIIKKKVEHIQDLHHRRNLHHHHPAMHPHQPKHHL